MEVRDIGRPGRPDPRLLQAAVEASGEAILITSADLDEPGPRIEYVNPAFTRMTGYEADEVLGLTPRILQGPATERAVLDRMRAALRAGEPFQGETVNYRKDGSTYVVEWLITPVREADGRISHWVSAQRDVTGRRHGEDRQEMMVRELHHRVKNTLATVQAVVNATARSSLSVAEFTRAFSGRIGSLARTHALITEDLAQAASFEGLLRAELDPYGERGRLTLDGPRVVLPSELAVPVGIGPAQSPGGRGQLGGEDQADRDCLAVPPAEVLDPLDGVRERVAVVEELAAAGVVEVLADGIGLDLHRPGDELGGVGAPGRVGL